MATKELTNLYNLIKNNFKDSIVKAQIKDIDGIDFISIDFDAFGFKDINIFQTPDSERFMIFDHTERGLPEGIGQQPSESVIEFIQNKLDSTFFW